jgi:hypothetical protein
VPAGIGVLSAVGDRCEMRFSAWDLRAAAARLAWFPWPFRVVSPEGLTDELAVVADRLGQASRRR